jgi:hypothetical protein
MCCFRRRDKFFFDKNRHSVEADRTKKVDPRDSDNKDLILEYIAMSILITAAPSLYFFLFMQETA